jgi:cellulose synthase/poly-beta-1,6-N-acetylglucosamine synthase-like glycosyltransferase
LLISIVVALALLLALVSLRGDAAREANVRRRLAERLPDSACPRATVIVPVKGFDEGLRENLESLATLDYPDYELIVVARAEEDLDRNALPARARLVLAGDGDAATGEKINNLLAAVAAADPKSYVLAFADSDGRVSPGWLRALVSPLHHPNVGASTGYRWHVPAQPTFWTLLRSAWNAVIAGGLGGGDNAFAWGGAMAIRREAFHLYRVPEHWRGTVSDDFLLSRAVHSRGLRIAFAPGALVASTDSTGGAEFLGWIERQMVITRIYNPKLWWLGLVSHLVYCGAMAGAVASPTPFRVAAVAVALGCGMWKGRRRARWARLCLPAHEAFFDRHGWIYTWWTPMATWVWLYSFLASARTDTIRWRGRRYRLIRPRGKL